MQRILLVEDDPAVVELVSSSLTNAGYQADSVDDGEAALEMIAQSAYDLMVLDVILPTVQGFDVCRRVRSTHSLLPILFLSGQGDPIDRILGLELGADDYLTKPFTTQELIARVRAILRRSDMRAAQAEEQNGTRKVFGDLCIDYDLFTVTRRGEPVNLTATEFHLLASLVENRGRTLTREDLREAVWGASSSGTQTVTSTINRLRHKIEDDPINPVYVLTMRGFGYRFADS